MTLKPFFKSPALIIAFATLFSCKKEVCNEGALDLVAKVKLDTAFNFIGPIDVPITIAAFGENCDGKRMVPPTQVQLIIEFNNGLSWEEEYNL